MLTVHGSSPFLKKAMHQNEKQVADNNRKIQVRVCS